MAAQSPVGAVRPSPKNWRALPADAKSGGDLSMQGSALDVDRCHHGGEALVSGAAVPPSAGSAIMAVAAARSSSSGVPAGRPDWAVD